MPTRDPRGCAIVPGCPASTATIDCLIDIVQGSRAVIDIQLWAADATALDLSLLSAIQVFLMNEYNNVVGIFSNPELIGSDLDYELEILQTGTGSSIQNKGLVRLVLPASLTETIPSGRLFAQISITYTPTTGSATGDEDTTILGCLTVANVLTNRYLSATIIAEDKSKFGL